MMPDLSQVGPAVEPAPQPVPEKIPAVVFDRVGKTYGRIHALSQMIWPVSAA